MTPWNAELLRFRSAGAADAAIIAEFNLAMAFETEGLRLDADRVRAGVESLLSDPGKGFYLLAEYDGRVCGQLLITYEWSDWRNGNFWWIQSVYVEPSLRGRGVFQGLYRYTEQLAMRSGACGLRLYVERENQGARRTYERCGMWESPYLMYEVDFVLGQRSSAALRSSGESKN